MSVFYLIMLQWAMLNRCKLQKTDFLKSKLKLRRNFFKNEIYRIFKKILLHENAMQNAIYMPIVMWFMRSGNSLGMLTQCGIRRWIEITLSSQLPRTTEILLAKPRVCTVSISAVKTDKTGSDSRNSRVSPSFENHQRAKMNRGNAKTQNFF